ncbi:MAG: response regulator transcription factor [Bryobacteraceae bacterium]|nr:response regulator transcription factor [Bryobacteraceae bacterium]
MEHRALLYRAGSAMESEMSLLIADELGLVRDGIAHICQAAGWSRRIYTCADGPAALDIVAMQRPSMLLIDFQLPKIFSLELVKQLRECGAGARILVMAAKGDRKLALETLRSGANGFFLKASSGADLIEALNRVQIGSLYVSPSLEFEKVFTNSGRESSTSDPVEQLSSREYQVFQLLVDGIRAKDIAARLSLSPKTVDTYRASLMRKLEIYDLASLVKFAIQREMITA